jgi:BirA family transcriptional regulator, biotin operon repressor / biotin---[acetyl-CoA-carboxylase] ligase
MIYIHKEVVTSTQTELLQNMASFPNLTVLSAGYQTQGHGQFDRQWESEANQNILCSILVKYISTERLVSIQKEVSLLIVDYMKKYVEEVQFKEPNDIIVRGKKIGGVIVESKTNGHEVLGVVIGFGINIFQNEFHYKGATSLQLEVKKPLDLKKIEKEIINKIIALF